MLNTKLNFKSNMNLRVVFTNFVKTPMFINDALVCISVDVTDALNYIDIKIKKYI